MLLDSMDIYVQKDGEKLGPLSEDQVRTQIDLGIIHPADLAWIRGKASWQPLSALIKLDMTLPPPLTAAGGTNRSSDDGPPHEAFQEPPPFQEPSPSPAEEFSNRSQASSAQSPSDFDRRALAERDDSFSEDDEPTSVCHVAKKAEGETVFFQDADNFNGDLFVQIGFGRWLHSPNVVVTNYRFKADTDSYSLRGVQNVSLETVLKAGGSGKAVQAGILAVAALIMVMLAYTLSVEKGAPATASDTLFMCGDLIVLWVIPVVLCYFTLRSWNHHKTRKYWEASIILTGPQGKSRTLIANFLQNPNSFERARLKRDGFDKKAIEGFKLGFNENVTRIQSISEAIGKAIHAR